MANYRGFGNVHGGGYPIQWPRQQPVSTASKNLYAQEETPAGEENLYPSFGTTAQPPAEMTPHEAQPEAPQPSIFGMTPNRFATFAGLAANALSPDSFGGRLGASMANMGLQQQAAQEHQSWYNELARRKAIYERQKQQQVQEILDRRQSVAGPMTPVTRPIAAPVRSPYGSAEVSMSIEEAPPAPASAPQRGYTGGELAQLIGGLGVEGFNALMKQGGYGGLFPTAESAATERAFQTMKSLRGQGLVPDDAQWKYTVGKEGLTGEATLPKGFAHLEPLDRMRENIRTGRGTPEEYAMFGRVYPERPTSERLMNVGPQEAAIDRTGKLLYMNPNVRPVAAAQGFFGAPPDTTIIDKRTGQSIGQTPPRQQGSISPEAEAMIPFYQQKIRSMLEGVGQLIPGSGYGGSNFGRVERTELDVINDIEGMIADAKTPHDRAAITSAWALERGQSGEPPVRQGTTPAPARHAPARPAPVQQPARPMNKSAADFFKKYE